MTKPAISLPKPPHADMPLLARALANLGDAIPLIPVGNPGAIHIVETAKALRVMIERPIDPVAFEAAKRAYHKTYVGDQYATLAAGIKAYIEALAKVPS